MGHDPAGHVHTARPARRDVGDAALHVGAGQVDGGHLGTPPLQRAVRTHLGPRPEHDDEVGSLGQRLERFRTTLPAAFHRRDPVVAQGNPGDRIRAHVREQGDNLVILGRTPTDAVTRWLLGSTSEAVLTGVPVSVLLVPVEKAAQA